MTPITIFLDIYKHEVASYRLGCYDWQFIVG
jgi:hypothetical protein